MKSVLRVRLQARIADLESMTLQKCGNSHGVLLLLLHANGQCLDTTEEEPRVEGTQTTTGSIDGEIEPVAQVRAIGCNNSCHDIVVTREIFSTALVDDICA